MSGARDGAAVRISETDVRQWPAEAGGALKAHRLLVRARPARTVVCPGCEADCVMPVQTIPAGLREAARFIVCDERSDINRVAPLEVFLSRKGIVAAPVAPAHQFPVFKVFEVFDVFEVTAPFGVVS